MVAAFNNFIEWKVSMNALVKQTAKQQTSLQILNKHCKKQDLFIEIHEISDCHLVWFVACKWVREGCVINIFQYSS